MKTDLVNLEVRFLLARYGERGVLQSIAEMRHESIEKLEAELVALETSKRKRAVRRARSGDEILTDLVPANDPRKSVLTEAARLFEQKRLLPSLRDAQDFVMRNTGRECKSKSRREALRPVLMALMELPDEMVRRALDEATRGDSNGDYELLAKQIMAGR